MAHSPTAVRIARELFAWGRGERRWFRVRGDSMSPTLEAGDCVLVDTCRSARAEPASVVVVRDPEDDGRVLVKRVASRGRETFSVASDNPWEGRDSRHFGSLADERLIGTSTLVLTRRGRVRMSEDLPTSRDRRVGRAKAAR